MAFRLFELVRETSVTTGTGDLQLAGAVTNYRAFSSILSNGDTTWATIKLGNAFETSLVTYNSGANSITRTLVLESSNSNALVNFGAGTKEVFIDLPAAAAPSPALTALTRANFGGI